MRPFDSNHASTPARSHEKVAGDAQQALASAELLAKDATATLRQVSNSGDKVEQLAKPIEVSSTVVPIQIDECEPISLGKGDAHSTSALRTPGSVAT